MPRTATPKKTTPSRTRQTRKKVQNAQHIQRIAILLGIVLVVFIFWWVYFYRPTFFFPKWKDYGVFGIDVSKYQGDIDWLQLENQEVKFAFLKATEGDDYMDKNFEDNWAAVKHTKIVRGAYHFYSPNTHWKKQADNFVQNVDLKKGDLPPVLDIEVIHGEAQEYLIEDAKKWLEYVEKHYKMRPIVYTYQSYYNDYLQEQFRPYNLWIANYNKTEPKLRDDAHWEFWQYAEDGKLHGIKGKVDLNCFFGTEDQLTKLTKR